MGLGNRKVIALCLSKVTEQVQVDTIRYLNDILTGEGYSLLVFATYSDLYHKNRSDDGESAVFDLINYDSIEGLIILSETIKDEKVVNKIVKACGEHHVPAVSIDKAVEGCYNILYDYTDAFEGIIRHVIEKHGCRRINLVAGLEGNAFSEERVEVFKRVLKEYGIPFEKECMGYGDFWEGPASKVVEGFLSNGRELPEAIVCSNDTMAMAACKVLEEHGYRVPFDVIVTGFDGIEMEQYHVPRLTTAYQDISKACRRAVDIILNLKKGEEPERVQKIPFDIGASQSCGCVPMSAKGKIKKVLDVYSVMNYRMDYDEHVSHMSVEMADAENIMAARDIISKYSFDLSRFCICNGVMDVTLLEDESSDVLTDTMEVFVANGYDWEQYYKAELVSFPAEQIIPDFSGLQKANSPIVVSTVHFLDKILGYYVAVLYGHRENYINLRCFVSELGSCMYTFRNSERMKFLLTKDPMTAIYNRRGFYQHIKKLLGELTEADEYRIMVHSVDLDGLKYINDTFGHKGGDNAITVAAHKLVEASSHGEICARFGGDEYVVFGIAPKAEAEEICLSYAKRFQELLEEYNANSGLPYKVLGSCGSSTVAVDRDMKLDQIINVADRLMYDEKAKHKRGNIRDAGDARS